MDGVAVVTGEDFLSPSFPAVTLTAGRTWHHVTRPAVLSWAARTGHRCVLGCRGFAGPIPPPLWMSVIQLCSKRDKPTAGSTEATIPLPRRGIAPVCQAIRHTCQLRREGAAFALGLKARAVRRDLDEAAGSRGVQS